MGKVYFTIDKRNSYTTMMDSGMIGRKTTDSVTLKDVPCNDWIAAYADHLKKSNKLVCQNGSTSSRPVTTTNLPHMMMIGSTLELLLSSESYPLDPSSESVDWPISSEAKKETVPLENITPKTQRASSELA